MEIVAGTDVGIPNGVAPLDGAGLVEVAYGGTGVSTLVGLVKGNGNLAFTSAVAGTDYVAPAVLGSPLGVATLDVGGKLSTTQIPASLVGGLNYQGTWNASSNLPSLQSGVGTKGYYYTVSTAGDTSIDGNDIWAIGDNVAFNGLEWERILGSDAGAFETLAVTSLTGYMYANGSGLVSATLAIQNANLVNSSIQLGTDNVALGSTVSTLHGVTVDGTLTPISNVSLASSVTGILPLSNGGTGVSTVPAAGQLLIGNGTGYAASTLTAGSGINVANGAGTITVTAAGVPNTALVNSTITLGSSTVALGSTTSSLTDLDLVDLTLSGDTTVNSALVLGIDPGEPGQYLTSNGAGAAPHWVTPAGGAGGTLTSVGLSAPSFLSVTNSPLTANGTLALSYSGTALPVSSGGTGATSLTGYLVGNGIGAFSAVATIPNAGLTNSSITLGSSAVALGETLTTVVGLTASGMSLTNGVSLSGINSTLTLAGDVGVAGQVLTSAGAGATPTWTTPDATVGTVTSVALTVPSFLSISGSPVTTAGTLAIGLSGSALPVANGGTGTTSLTGIAIGSGTDAFAAATEAQIVAAIGNTAVARASSLTSSTVSTDSSYYIAFAAALSGYQDLGMNTGLQVNPSTGSILSGVQGGSF